MKVRAFYAVALALVMAPRLPAQDAEAPIPIPALPPLTVLVNTNAAPATNSAPAPAVTNASPRPNVPQIMIGQDGNAVSNTPPQLPVPPRPTFPPMPSPPGLPSLPAGLRPPPSLPGAPGLTPALPGSAALAPGALPTVAGALAPGMTLTNAASDKSKEEATISYHLPAASLPQVIDLYCDLVKRVPIRSGGQGAVPDTATFSLDTKGLMLTKTEAIQFLEAVLGAGGVTMVNIEDKFVKVVAEGGAGKVGGAPLTGDPSQLPGMGKYVQQIIQLKYVLPDQNLQAALTPFAKSPESIIIIPSTSTLILRDYAENVKRMAEMVEKIDVLVTNEIKTRVIPIKYALAGDIAGVLSSLGGTTVAGIGGSPAGGGLRGLRSSAPMTGGGSGYNQPGQQPGMGGINNPAAAGAPGLANRNSFQGNLASIVARAARGASGSDFQLLQQAKIIPDERTNSLLVFANDTDMDVITNIVAKLDVVLAQVLIEAIIMEVSLDNSSSYGLSYLQAKMKLGTPSGTGLNNLSSSAGNFINNGVTSSNATTLPNLFTGLPGGFSYFNKLSSDLDVVMEAVAGDSRVNVLSRPRIQTSHAVEAQLFVGDTIPYVQNTSYGGGYGGFGGSSYTTKEVGIELDVMPLINSDGLVVMDIQQNIEQLGKSYNIVGVGDIPSTTKRQASAKVAVRDRETIILGGFISASRNVTHSGIPYLMDLPVLGGLFRNKSEDKGRTELIVLIRPTVLRTPELAADYAREERNKMSGVKQAELDFRADEAERNAAIEAELRKEQAARDKAAKKKKPLPTNSVPAFDY